MYNSYIKALNYWQGNDEKMTISEYDGYANINLNSSLTTSSFVKKENDESIFIFKNENSLSQRKRLRSKLHETYPKKIPIILASQNKSIILTREKFLTTEDYTMVHFIREVRNSIRDFNPYDALFLLTEKHTVIPSHMTMIEVYRRHKNEEDGFLYFIVSRENFFGARVSHT